MIEKQNTSTIHTPIQKKRFDGRGSRELRPLSLEYDAFGYAASSVYLCQGNTKVLCAITLQPSVPHFLRGQGTGWLTAEYSMLPSATQQRSLREASQQQRNSRSIEISRIIGRCLRTCVDLRAFGEQTIIIDCDVLQADGGTRVACITAASLALKEACLRWYKQGLTKSNIFKELVYAISVGIVHEEIYLDLAYYEDSNASADFNFITTESGNILEIQGTAEKQAIPWKTFEQLKDVAVEGISALIASCSQKIPSVSESIPMYHNPISSKQKSSLFSIGHRVHHK